MGAHLCVCKRAYVINIKHLLLGLVLFYLRVTVCA